MGHTGFDCSKDPNLKTIRGTEVKSLANNDLGRIQRIESELANKKRLNYLSDFSKFIQQLMKQAQLDTPLQEEGHEEEDEDDAFPLVDESRILQIKEKLLTFDDFNYAFLNHDLETGSVNKKVVTLEGSLKQDIFKNLYADESLTPRGVMPENQELNEGDTFVLDKTQELLNNSFGDNNNNNINELSLDVHLDISKQIK